jgi:hypothetical protein
MTTPPNSGSDPTVETLSGMLTSVRAEAFDLVDGLDRAGRNSPKLRAAGERMQSIANQIGAVQASLKG